MHLGTISADHSDFRATLADIAAAIDRLHIERDRVAHHVDGLLDGGWAGPAAASYAEAWNEWRAGGDRVLDGLVTMGHLIDAVHVDLTECDIGSQSDLARLTTRLG